MKNKYNRPATNNCSESISNRSKTNFLLLHYTDENSLKIGSIFKKFGINPAYKIKRQNLNKKTQVTPKEEGKGVYMITCNAGEEVCNKKYIGYTDRTFHKRFNEHAAKNHRKPSSVVAQHLKSHPQHNINFNTSLVLRYSSNKEASKIYEQYHIYK